MSSTPPTPQDKSCVPLPTPFFLSFQWDLSFMSPFCCVAWRATLTQTPSLIEGLRVVPAFLYRRVYSMKISLKEARSPGITEVGRSD